MHPKYRTARDYSTIPVRTHESRRVTNEAHNGLCVMHFKVQLAYVLLTMCDTSQLLYERGVLAMEYISGHSRWFGVCTSSLVEE